jgi:hypothetical protein
MMYDRQEFAAFLPENNSNEKNRESPSDISTSEPSPALPLNVFGELRGQLSCIRALIQGLTSQIPLHRLKIPRTMGRVLTRTEIFYIFTLISQFIITWVLIPLQPRFLQRNGLRPRKKAHATIYLDSLRGWAAVIVFNHHFVPIHFPFFYQPFTFIWIQGWGMVDLFFVISGYVLSYKMVKLMRLRQTDTLFDTIVSSVFRRYMRLYGSVALASFISMILIRWDLGPHSRPGLRYQTLREQVFDCASHVFWFSNPFVNIPGSVSGSKRHSRR